LRPILTLVKPLVFKIKVLKISIEESINTVAKNIIQPIVKDKIPIPFIKIITIMLDKAIMAETILQKLSTIILWLSSLSAGR